MNLDILGFFQQQSVSTWWNIPTSPEIIAVSALFVLFLYVWINLQLFPHISSKFPLCAPQAAAHPPFTVYISSWNNLLIIIICCFSFLFSCLLDPNFHKNREKKWAKHRALWDTLTIRQNIRALTIKFNTMRPVCKVFRDSPTACSQSLILRTLCLKMKW